MVLILSSPKTLKLEVGSKMAFFSLLGLPLREMMAKKPKPQCRQPFNTQVNAEKSPKTVTARLIFKNVYGSLFPGVCSRRQVAKGRFKGPRVFSRASRRENDVYVYLEFSLAHSPGLRYI